MDKNFKILRKGLACVKGFEFAGVEANIKYRKKKDMAIIFSKYPLIGAGTWTKNHIKAACVEFSQKNIKNPLRAIIVNSGVANACTGDLGAENCTKTADLASKALGVESSEILLASTGVIGVQLPMDKIENGINRLIKAKNATAQAAKDASLAIMTTDTKPKVCAIECIIGGKRVQIAGIAKGSGMIHPNMATMLGFIITNANISQKLLQKALSRDVKNTYNMVSVDGDTSTNDMVLALSNKRARHSEIVDSKSEDYKTFRAALNFVNTNLARQIAQDGEGATKLCEVRVNNACSKKQAKILAKSVIKSSLVKTALFGNDANWGRIICAMGYSGAKFNSKKLDLSFESKAGKIEILKNGVAVEFSERAAKKILLQKEVAIVLNLNDGKKSAVSWGCDLSYEYIKINADYRS